MKIISFTSHMDLRPEDEEQVKRALVEKLMDLKIKYPGFAILTGVAEGGDALVISLAEDLGIKVKLLTDVLCQDEGEKPNDYYRRQGMYLIANTQVLLVLWDGIFNGKPGGTSDVVCMALETQPRLEIHQLPVPRLSNAFPVAFASKEPSPNPFPFRWNIISINKKARQQNSLVRVASSFIKNQVFWTYVLPLLLILISLVGGFMGYWQPKPDGGFLKTLRTTILHFTHNEAPNGALVISKLAGIGILIYAIGYGFFVTLKSYRQNARRWWWQISGNFSVLWGNPETLAEDILSERPLVVVSETEIEMVETTKFKPITVGPSVKLEDLYIEKASDLFICQTNDAQNIEKVLEIEHFLEKKPIPDIYVELKEEANIVHTQHILSTEFLEKSRFYSPVHLCVRNLLLRYSPYKFHWDSSLLHCHFTIIGFEVLGQALLLQLLKQVHYEKKRKVLINLYCQDAEKAAREFYVSYPILKENTKITAYVWGNFNISFFELPQNKADLLHNMPQMFENINETNSTQIYFCLKGLINSQLAEVLLPSISIRKEKTKAAMDVFIYTTATSEIARTKIEKYFRKITPKTNVVCFTDTPGLKEITDNKPDQLAMSINALYDVKSDRDVVSEWHKSTEKNKNSSRQAADHLWTKIKILGPSIAWNFENQEEYFTKNPEKLNELGDIEHRRWCAELLLRGHRPITEDTNSSLYLEISENWDKPAYGSTKKSYVKALEHIDLVPYEDLHPVEAEKDLTQIKAIPNLLQKLKL